MPMMNPFELERYFARWEFTAPFLLSASDTEPLAMSELLRLASPEMIDAWANLSLGYTESTGHPLLRQAIAGL
ncbi:MAG: aminotransferase, partial [Chloroflexi bacterium]|nr:aminotransferase [Chloroflexota bacterium]